MNRQLLAGTLFLGIGLAGCTWDNSRAEHFLKTGEWNFDNPASQKVPEAQIATAARVDQVGGRVLNSIPELKPSVLFLTHGGDEIAITHHGVNQIDISEGMVNQCKTDNELAAVLAYELARLSLDKEARANIGREREGPPPVPYDRDVANARTSPDQTELSAAAMWEKNNPHRGAVAQALDPNTLAQCYLKKAEYDPSVLTKVTPLIRQGESNPNFDAPRRILPEGFR